jgi:hypothetical protein
VLGDVYKSTKISSTNCNLKNMAVKKFRERKRDRPSKETMGPLALDGARLVRSLGM